MRPNPTAGTTVDDHGRAPEPEPAPGGPLTHRDWLWGAFVVVGVTVLGVVGTIWVLASLVFACCGTRPAPGV